MKTAYLCLLAAASAGALAQDPGPPLRLLVLPPAIQLDHQHDTQRIVVLALDGEDVARDVTAHAGLTITDAAIASLQRTDSSIAASPRGDGTAELVATLGAMQARVPLAVRGSAERPAISFRNDVLPALTRGGCNAGSCHGAATGKNGFALSLFGYDPTRDHLALARELRGRRLDLGEPAQSLVLQKATAAAAHQGGKRLAIGDPIYRTLHGWIEQGAADDEATAPRLLGLEVWPSVVQLQGPGSRLPLVVLARYDDGSDRDVTALSLWSSGDEAAARVDGQGVVTTGRAGEASILCRYGGFAQVARVQVHDGRRPPVWPADLVAVNFVDEFVFAKLRRARALPAPRCSDAGFVRRVHLDLCAVLPTPAAARAFLDDPSPDKRERLIDELLATPEFAARQAMAWAELLQVDAETMEPKGAFLFGRHLREAFARQRPFDEVVRELLVAEGSAFANPAANFHLIGNQPHLVAEKTAQVLLGVRLQCAQCHNHPFENWTMDDYYGFAAFFGQVGRKRGADPYEWVIWDRQQGDVRNPRDGRVAAPRLPGQGPVQVPAGTDRRAVLADWLVAADNPFFARNVANRVFAGLFGRGLVEPADDVRIGNPPSHPELLDQLARLLVDSRFDVRPLVRAICRSHTYQSAVAEPGTEPRLFAGRVPRRLSAEELLDGIGAVTGVPTRYPGLPPGAPATALDAGRTAVRFLEAFGRPPRQGACTCDRSSQPTLSQTLHLIAGDTIRDKIADANGRLLRALAAGTAPAALLEELFLAAYSRRPAAAEAERLLGVVAAAGEPRAAFEDLFWAVLNSKEFQFQH